LGLVPFYRIWNGNFRGSFTWDNVNASKIADNALMRRPDTTSDLKVLIQYLDHALTFERLATEEPNGELQAAFVNQAHSYRELAAKCAEKLGLPAPSPSAIALG
jgi:hypothetical protein